MSIFSTPARYFAENAQAREYNRLQRRLSVADVALSFAVLAGMLFAGWSNVLRGWSFKFSTGGFAISVFFYVVMLSLVLKACSFPLEFYGFRLEHRFHLTDQKMGAWLWDEAKGWMVGLVLGTIAAEVVYYIIRQTGSSWWIWSWLAFAFLFVVLAQLAPVLLLPLFFKFKPLEDADLKARLERMSARAGVRVRGIYEWKLSEKSKKANAALTGLGATRRILVADTLLANFTHDEIEAVLAHELGHHVHRHIVWGIVVQSIASLVAFIVAAQALAYAVEECEYFRGTFSGLHDFAALPVLLLAGGAVGLLLMPALNAYSRFNERQADSYCWQSIPSVAPYISAMEKLETQNLAEHEPARWIEVLFHSHPSLARRIAAAQAYAKAHKK